MKTRSYNSRFVEALEGRSMMSTVALADFNNDGRMDKAELTNSTTITVSLQNGDGSYTVSANLTTAKNRPAGEIYVGDYNADGKWDINTVSVTNSGGWFTQQWLGNGDGTFGSRTTSTFRWPKHGGFF
jgi:hypothetical protein